MSDKNWFDLDSHDTLGASHADGTISIYPKEIGKTVKTIFDPIFIDEFWEEMFRMIVIVTDIEEDLHYMICDYAGIDTLEEQDHEAMRWMYERD